MGARKKVELNEAWWKQVWPVEGKEPPKFREVTSAIKTYKTCKRGLSAGDLVMALNEVERFLLASQSAAKTDLKAMDKKQSALFTRDMEAALKMVSERKSDAMRVGNETQTVYERDISKELNSRFVKKMKPPLHMGKTVVSFELLVAVVNELKAKSGDVQLNRGYNDLVDDCIDAIEAEVLKKGPAIYAAKADPAPKFKAIIDGHLAALNRAGLGVPTNVLRKLNIYGDIQKSFEARIAKKVGKAAVSTVSATAAGVAVVLPGTQALAVVGACLAGAQALRDIADVAMTLETKASVLSAYLGKEEKRLLKLRDRASVEEFGAGLLNELTGLDVFPTLKKAKGDFKDLEKGVQILMHRLGVKQTNMNTAIDNMDKITKQLNDKIKGNAGDEKLSEDQLKEMKSLQKKVDKSVAYVQKMAGPASDMMARAVKLEKKYDKLKGRVDDMLRMQGKVKSASTAAEVVGVLGALAVGCYGVADAVKMSKAENVVQCAKGISSISIASVALAKDIGTTVKGLA